MWSKKYFFAGTKKGHTKSRLGQMKYSILLYYFPVPVSRGIMYTTQVEEKEI
jgi:hypothetical protein